jgi:hypothetical protein
MQFLNSLKGAWAGAEAKRKPQNLLELAQMLTEAAQQRKADGDLKLYCKNWGKQVLSVFLQNDREMSGMRGLLGELWNDQADIYREVMVCIEEAQSILDSRNWNALESVASDLREAIEDLMNSIANMQEWRISDQRRCLGCGWSPSGSDYECPDCRVTALSPVKQSRAQESVYAELTGPMLELFESIMAVLSGKKDIEIILRPLDQLGDHYRACLRETRRVCSTEEIAAKLLPHLERLVSGLDEIERAYEHYQAQSLEDGWFDVFMAYNQVTELLPSEEKIDEERQFAGALASQDLVCLSLDY